MDSSISLENIPLVKFTQNNIQHPKCWFFRREENWSGLKKTLGSRQEPTKFTTYPYVYGTWL